jgi:hypothetical protein
VHPPAVLWSLRSYRWALAFAAAVGGVCAALPLLGTIGPESSLALSLLVSPWAAAAGARLSLRSRGVASAALLGQALLVGLTLAGAGLGVLSLATLWGERCDPWAGLPFALLGPCCSLPLAAVVGAAVGALGLGPRAATLLAVALPAGEVARTLWGFVSTPGIFAFGHFFGYFSGTLYDRHAEVPSAWLWHRGFGAAIGITLALALSALRVRSEARVRLARARIAVPQALLSLLGAALVATFGLHAHTLGFRSDAAHIEAQLGQVVRTPRCRAVLPRELPLDQATRLAEDCELRIEQAARGLGVREQGPITAYFFRSVDEKRALMGAYRVYIAKPWRREVYVQLAGFPHPVLAHELAHVVGRLASDGVFGVPGRLGGLIPEPTLVEGLAVALDRSVSDELTPHQLAAAAHGLRIAPPLAELLGPRFLAQNQALAYTLAGSFLGFVGERYGAEALARVYRTADYAGTLGKPLDTLEGEWRVFLAGLPSSDAARALAEQRFERPGVLSQVCPHDVEAREAELGDAVAARDLTAVVARADEVLAIDPTAHGARIAKLSALGALGDPGRATAELAALGDLRAPRTVLARARLALADAELARGERNAAGQAYLQLLDAPDSEAELRQREVRLMAATSPGDAGHELAALLVGSGGAAPEPRVAMHHVARLDRLRRDGLAPYLEARQLMAAERHDLALTRIRDAHTRGLPSQRLRTEALRMQLACAFTQGALDEAEACCTLLEELGGAPAREARDYRERVALRRAGR